MRKWDIQAMIREGKWLSVSKNEAMRIWEKEFELADRPGKRFFVITATSMYWICH